MGSNQAPCGDPGIPIHIPDFIPQNFRLESWFSSLSWAQKELPSFCWASCTKGSTKGSIEPETQKQQTQYLSQAEFKRKVVCNHRSKGPCSAASCFALFTQSWGPGWGLVTCENQRSHWDTGEFNMAPLITDITDCYWKWPLRSLSSLVYSLKMVIFHRFLYVYQRHLPWGKHGSVGPQKPSPDLLVLHLLRRRSRRHLPAYEGNASCTPKTPWFLDAPFRKTIGNSNDGGI